MYGSRRRGRQQRLADRETPELDVTPFMNLMIVLVPVLLLSLVFTRTMVIELAFPANDPAPQPVVEEPTYLEIRILADELVIADHRGVIDRISKDGNGHNYGQLNELMLGIKQRLPGMRDAVILLQPDTDYQTLVMVMDSIRTHQRWQDGEVISLELFPNVSLGDVAQPEVST